MRGHRATLAAGALLALFGWMAASVSRVHSTTADEIFHLTAGYSYWTLGDYRLQPENGNFPQRWAALPLLVQDVKFPKLDQPAWRAADAAEIGHQFFYESGNDLSRMLTTGRMMIALLGIACGALVFAWSRSLFGSTGALVSTALFSFCPLLLAHGGLVTSDMAATLGFLAATLAGWRLLHRVTPGRVLLAGLAWGLLALAKFSAPLFAAIFVGMLAVRLTRRAPLPVGLISPSRRLRGGPRFAALLASSLVAVLVAMAVVWAAYGFRFDGLRGPGGYNHAWAEYHAVPGGGAFTLTVAEWARSWHVLPEAWLQGFAHTAHFALGRPAFFMGRYGSTGWLAYFPVGFLLKTTLPALGLLALAVIAFSRQARSRHWYRFAPLAVLVVVYGGFALTSHLNIGLRHLLPIYPVLYIFAGAVVWLSRNYSVGADELGQDVERKWARGGPTNTQRVFGAVGPSPMRPTGCPRSRRPTELLRLSHRTFASVAVGALLLWHAGDSVAIRPHYLAYFNPLLGGPAHGYEHFVDSSLDWGQDLPGLKRWLDANTHGEKIYLSYFGSGSPAYEGIHATRIADGYFDVRDRELLPEMTGGVYCLSATMFQQAYTLVRHGWTPEHERRYGNLRSWADAWRAGRDSTPREAAISRMVELEHLRFGRLCAGLHVRPPDAEVGYSILIFRLTEAQVRALLDGPPTFLP